MRIEVVEDPAEVSKAAGLLSLVPGHNLITGQGELAAALGKPLTTLEDDLMLVASSVFAADLAVRRGDREHYGRSITLKVPVINLHAFERFREQLSVLLYLLSDDNWNIEFVQRPGEPEVVVSRPTSPGKMLLFSGGLDSFAAAVDILEGGEPLHLASHYTSSPSVVGSQRRLHGYLQEGFPDKVARIAVRSGGKAAPGLPFPADSARETTQRTRSFMFLVIGAIASRHVGIAEVLMIAENGQMAIHLPLTPSRIGAFSTHTAHPEFISEMQDWLAGLLSYPIVLSNPFLYMTKAEVVSNLVARHSDSLAYSSSCWRGSRQAASHCGECVPCLVRRVALGYHGKVLDEYHRDILSEDLSNIDEADIGRTNLIQMLEFAYWFSPNHSDAIVLEQFPDLFNLSFDQHDAIAMYRRFSTEVSTVLSRYPLVKPFMR